MNELMKALVETPILQAHQLQCRLRCGRPSDSCMIVLAFLQNMWVKDPAKVRAMIARTPTVRARLIHYALFANWLTGRRLKAALGPWCDRITWEEASPVITDNARECPPPDEDHIKAVLAKHKPDVVICFSRPAQKMIRDLCWPPHFITAPHPACRAADTMVKLIEVRRSLEQLDRSAMGTE